MNTNACLTLLIYWSIAVGLLCGGLYALSMGFKLVLSGKGKNKEECTIEVLGLRATVGSIGALVMITAFLWGWAAAFALPTYKDRDVVIACLKQALDEKAKEATNLSVALAARDTELGAVRTQIASLENTSAKARGECLSLLEEHKTQVAALETSLAKQEETIKALAVASEGMKAGAIAKQARDAATAVSHAKDAASDVQKRMNRDIGKLKSWK